MGKNEERFRALMESGNNRSVGALQKAIYYYQSCMDRRRVEADSLPALTNLLTQLGERKEMLLATYACVDATFFVCRWVASGGG